MVYCREMVHEENTAFRKKYETKNGQEEEADHRLILCGYTLKV